MRTAWIIASGTELILGQSRDTNSAWIAAQLAAVGVRCARMCVVGDDLAALRDVLRTAAATADVVILTGGLGPTEDDLTRQALAEASGDQLVCDEASLAQIRAFFAARGRQMPERNVVQALRPSRGEALPNPVGTAPGIVTPLGRATCFALPGVPIEMREMFAAGVAPRLRGGHGSPVLLSRRLNSYGLTEADVGQRLQDLMQRGRNPEVGTTAEMSIIGVRLNALAETVEAAERMLNEAEAAVRQRLGGAVFGTGDDTLAHALCRRLWERGETVAVAESCTGGLIGKLITDVPGSSRCFVGGVVAYANSVKEEWLHVPPELFQRHGAVSEPVAEVMARQVRERMNATYGLSATGIAGPQSDSSGKPVGLVHLGLATPDDVSTRTIRLGDSPREMVRMRAAQAALALLLRRFEPL
jgi:nicotinamide-nucleotide amidase